MDDYFDLGTFRRPVTTQSREAQLWFDRSLIWCYGYNHEESERCFKKAAEGADTEEAIEVLERAMAKLEQAGDDRHPGLLHMYIHLMEMPPHPERALRACDDLRDLVPDAGHLRHMPTHIDVLCGHYHNVVTSNIKAIVADRKYLER